MRCQAGATYISHIANSINNDRWKYVSFFFVVFYSLPRYFAIAEKPMVAGPMDRRLDGYAGDDLCGNIFISDTCIPGHGHDRYVWLTSKLSNFQQIRYFSNAARLGSTALIFLYVNRIFRSAFFSANVQIFSLLPWSKSVCVRIFFFVVFFFIVITTVLICTAVASGHVMNSIQLTMYIK